MVLNAYIYIKTIQSSLIKYIFLFRINKAIKELEKFTKTYNDRENKLFESVTDTVGNNSKI